MPSPSTPPATPSSALLSPQEEAHQLAEDFELLDNWEERYGYIIDLGKALPPLPKALQTPENKVQGCTSQVWMVAHKGSDGGLTFFADSDAIIVRGLIAILLRIFSRRTPDVILATDPLQLLAPLGLTQHLSPNRANGLHSMVARMHSLAKQCL